MRRLIVDASPTVPVCLMWHTYSNLSIRGKKFAKRANWSVLSPRTTPKNEAGRLVCNHKPTLDRQPYSERMKIVPNHNSAVERGETPHTINPNQEKTLKASRCISVAYRRRAESLINDRSIDAGTRAVIRYALETNDPWLAELVRRACAGESLFDTADLSHIATSKAHEKLPTEEKVEALTEIICRSGDDPATRSAALLVLIAMVESSRTQEYLRQSPSKLRSLGAGN